MPRPIFWTFTMSYSSILADRSSKFQAKLRHRAKLRHAPRACVRGSFDDADRAHAGHARGTNAISASVVFLAINWAVLALLPVRRRVSALPPVSPVFLTPIFRSFSAH